MQLKDLRDEARKRLGAFCRVCPVCDGRACAGEVPGMGGTGTGASFKENVRSLEKVKVLLRTIHNATDPQLSWSFLGMELGMPIMAAPMCNSTPNTGGALSEGDMVSALMTGAADAGSLGWIGDPADPQLFMDVLRALESAGRGVAIIKPRVDTRMLRSQFEQACNAGATAVGIDVDGAGLLLMKLKGQAVGPKTAEQLGELVGSTKLPFIVKGIMTEDEALACVDAGVSAIVVSNHGGRVLDHTPGTATVLPAIAKAVAGRIPVLVDGGIRSGVDVLKMLALGADGVLVGRPLIVGAYGGGAEGVRFLLERYATELYSAMIMTGCATLADISPAVLQSSGNQATA